MNLRLPLLLVPTLLTATDFAITTVDEQERPLAEVTVKALLSRPNDPRYASLRTFEGKTDAQGVFRFRTTEELCLIRLRAQKDGHYPTDADHQHGLGVMPTARDHRITLPKLTEEIPLCFKDVLLSTSKRNFALRTWVGFDLAASDAVAPWGEGKVSDLRFWNEGEQVGWTLAEHVRRELRHDDDHRGISDEEFAVRFGKFRGTLRIGFAQPGDGLQRTPAYWPASTLRMPALAPEEGYAHQLDQAFAPRPAPSMLEGQTGSYLRVRTRLGSDGKVLSANYAKVDGPIECGYGWVAFRYYYNPVANDRRLVMDTDRNLLKPPPKAGGRETLRYLPGAR
jgi:hypothetical protein